MVTYKFVTDWLRDCLVCKSGFIRQSVRALGLAVKILF
jgi:hypothetical protein